MNVQGDWMSLFDLCRGTALALIHGDIDISTIIHKRLLPLDFIFSTLAILSVGIAWVVQGVVVIVRTRIRAKK